MFSKKFLLFRIFLLLLWFLYKLKSLIIISFAILIVLIGFMWIISFVAYLLNMAFKPLIPYNRDVVFFENFRISEKQDLYKWYKKAENKLLFFYELQKDVKGWFISFNTDEDQIIYWRQIEDILKQLWDIYIFKNWISGEYKLTRIGTQKIRLITTLEDKEWNIKPMNIYNPFILQWGWIFINERKQEIKINKNLYKPYFNFEKGSDAEVLDWIKCEKGMISWNNIYQYWWEKWWFNLKIPKWVEKVGEYVKNFKEREKDLLDTYYKTVLDMYEDIDIDVDGSPKDILVCSDEVIKINYYLKNPKNEDIFEKYTQYWMVCFEIWNIYSTLNEKDSWRIPLHSIKIWTSPDITVSLNIYNLITLHNKIKDEKAKKKFEERYKVKIEENKKYYNFLRYYKANWLDLKRVFDIWKIKEANYFYKENKLVVDWRWDEKIIKTWYIKRWVNYTLWYEKDISEWKISKIEDVPFEQPITRENIYFWYLNALLFWNLNFDKDELIQIAKWSPNYVINIGSLRDKDYYNYYIRKILYDKKMEEEKNWFKNFFFSTNVSIEEFFKWTKIIKKECKITWLPSFTSSLSKSYQEIDKISISPLFTFFTLPPKKVEKTDVVTEKYFKTEFENIDVLFDLNKIKDANERIKEILNSKYIEEKFTKDDFFDPDALGYIIASDVVRKQVINFLTDVFTNEETYKKYRERYKEDYLLKIVYHTFLVWHSTLHENEKSWIEKIKETTSATVKIVSNIITLNIDWASEEIALAGTSKFYKECINNNQIWNNFLNDQSVMKDIINKKNNIIYWRNYLKYIWNWIIDFWNKEAEKENQKVDKAACENAVVNAYVFIKSLDDLKKRLKELENFKETYQTRYFSIINWLIKPEYVYHNTFLYKMGEQYYFKNYPREILYKDEYLIIRWINIFDKENKEIIEGKWYTLSEEYYAYWDVSDEFIKDIKNIDCKKLLEEWWLPVNNANISKCELWKKALKKLFDSWMMLSQAKTYLKTLLETRREWELLQVFYNYGVAWYCTWYVQKKYPEINFRWHAKQRCENAREKWWEVIYNPDKVWPGAVVIRDWWEYWHVWIVKKINKEKWTLIVDNMNWKWLFIQSFNEVSIRDKWFKCYIKIR